MTKTTCPVTRANKVGATEDVADIIMAAAGSTVAVEDMEAVEAVIDLQGRRSGEMPDLLARMGEHRG